MATTLAATIESRLGWEFKNLLDLSTPINRGGKRKALSFANGTGSNQINNMFEDRRTVAFSANDDLDLYGVLVNAFGSTLNFTKIKGIEIFNLGPTSTAAVGYTPTEGENLGLDSSVSASVTSLFDASITSKLLIPSGGSFKLTAPLGGLTVTLTTADILRIKNRGTVSIDYDIIIYGLG